MYFCHLLILFPTMLVSKGFPCTNMLEYYHKSFGCRPCAACIKGTGIDHKQKINRTHYGMMSCYSCYECQTGTYQNESHVIKSCKPCNTCTNQRILRNCSTTENVLCGNCFPGYQVIYVYGRVVCEKIENCFERAFMISTIVLCFLLLLAILSIIWLKRKKIIVKEKIPYEIPQVHKENYEGVDDATFALNIGNDWKYVARHLNFTETDIQEIENNEKQLRDRAFHMIRIYRQKHEPQNDEALIKALIEIKQYDLLVQKQEVGPGEADPLQGTDKQENKDNSKLNNGSLRYG